MYLLARISTLKSPESRICREKHDFQDCSCTHLHQDPRSVGEVVWKWSLVCSFRRSGWLVQLTFSLQDTNSKPLSARSELWRLYGLCCAEVLGWFVSHEAQASTRPHCCLSVFSPGSWSALSLTAKIVTLSLCSNTLLSVLPFFLSLFFSHLLVSRKVTSTKLFVSFLLAFTGLKAQLKQNSSGSYSTPPFNPKAFRDI